MSSDLHTLVVGREAMGCRFEVAFNAGEHAEATELAIAALDLVEELEERLSIYRDTSELSRLNATAATGWQPVSEPLFALVARAAEIHAATRGGFDIATGALVRAWGFRERRGRVPDGNALAEARTAAGMHLVELDREGRRIRFARPGVEIDPGAIGKGWAIDAAVGLLAGYGVQSVLVHGGQSSVRARGIQGPAIPGRAGWRVGLAHPLRPGRRLATFTLLDRALGTSGSGTRFFLDRGRRIGHILDPRSGLPAEGVLCATVLAPSAGDADALSTALFALGREGIGEIAPPGSEVAAVLVEPGPGATVRMLVANLPTGTIRLEADAGVVVEEAAPSRSRGGAG